MPSFATDGLVVQLVHTWQDTRTFELDIRDKSVSDCATDEQVKVLS